MTLNSVREHYDSHLGPVYEWMVGDFDAAKEAARTELRTAGLSEDVSRVALDLGAGPGVHAIALAEAGYDVTAIDTCAVLLDQLRARAEGRMVTCVNDDILNLRHHCRGNLDVILCMGDTLTHLASVELVERLFETIADALGPQGIFVATFRDYCHNGPDGVERFIPVRQDDNRILTCFLDYQDKTVEVYDLLYERTPLGWTYRASGYSKLRLNPEWARSTLQRLGLTSSVEAGPRGMVRLLAKRPG
jgi:SAM-dependent methyltransferase